MTILKMTFDAFSAFLNCVGRLARFCPPCPFAQTRCFALPHQYSVAVVLDCTDPYVLIFSLFAPEI